MTDQRNATEGDPMTPASSPTGDTAAAAPDVWWSPTLGVITNPGYGELWVYSDHPLAGAIDELPADAVRLVPAPSSSPDDTAPAAELALIDDLISGLRLHYRQPERIHRGWTGGVEVRGDVADEWIRRRDDLVARAAASAAVPDTAPAPGYDRIAQAIADACEAADVHMDLYQGLRRLLSQDRYPLLAKVLDKAGLIDWSAFTVPVTADGDTEEAGRG